jgi:tetratricopeptide (TPR) repeat protein
VIKEARVTGKRITLELMGLEGVVSFEADMSDKAREVFQVVKASYDTGMRIKLGYVPVSGDDSFTLAELCQSEDACALTFAESHALAVQRQGHWHGAFAAALILAAVLAVWAFLLRLKVSRTDGERSAFDGALAGLLGVLAVFAIGRVGYIELLRWSGDQVEEVGRLYNDVGFREAIVQADRALGWGILDPDERHELRRLKADAMQTVAVEEASDAMQMEALAIFEELLADDPESSEYLKSIGYSFIYLGAYPEATAIGHRLVAVGNDYWGNIRLALVHRVKGEHDEAEAYYQKARDGQGEWYGMPLNYHRAKNHVLAGDNEAAISAINKGMEYQDNYAWAYAFRACAKANLDDMTGALEDYLKALEIMRTDRAESTTPDRIFPPEQEIADIVQAFEGGAPAVPDSGNYCSVHTAEGETRRDRSSLLPASYMPAYLVVHKTGDDSAP